ncbi:hypothetical protein FSP39_014687 [Pinctada imbricata]|uniref:DNA 3'-5' helicase n=1 Tax=Pinctada imbricata TaxID=66713 RepID=A0AA89C6U8_PINIB|nr:hypothetical protein FSP39_014687 [Pinctada imbricata]
MKEQVEKLNSNGLRATHIGKDIGENEEIINGQFSYLFGSPESFVGDSKWREVLKSEPYRNNLKLIVVDEAHTVTLWGEGRESEDPFRECFSKISEMRSLCPNIPFVALTATALPTQRRKIIKSLCFRPGYELFIDSPDRKNIKISVKTVSNSDSFETIFEWLIQDLNQFKEQTARHVIFCESISDVTKVYLTFVKICNQSRENFQMFHSKTSEDVKDLIRKDMSVDGKIRILVCTNAAGMGVNYYQVHNVVHYGLPREIDTFVQQMGRGGRDGAPSNELVLFKVHRGRLKHMEPELIRFAKENSVCRRKLFCLAFQTNCEELTPLHICCDVCEKMCKCTLESCPETHVAMRSKEVSESSDEDMMQRNVSDKDRQILSTKLESLYFSLSEEAKGGLLNGELVHGLTTELITNVVSKCDVLFTPEDVMHMFPIWSYKLATKIYTIISDVFEDHGMYNLLNSENSSSDSD